MTNSDIQALFARRYTMAAGETLVIQPIPGQESVCIKVTDAGSSGLLELMGTRGYTTVGGQTFSINGISGQGAIAAGSFFPLDTNPFPMQCRGALAFIASGNTVSFAILYGRTQGGPTVGEPSAWR